MRAIEFGKRITVELREYPVTSSGVPCPKWGVWKGCTYYNTMRFVTKTYCVNCLHNCGFKSDADLQESMLCRFDQEVRHKHRELLRLERDAGTVDYTITADYATGKSKSVPCMRISRVE